MAGRTIWKAFSRKEKESIKLAQPTAPAPTAAEIEDTDHGQTFGVVYANDLALAETKKERPNFPVGSILVREKNALENSPIPQTVIAMVKREMGFSKETNDWEFFLFDGYLMNLKVRETVGSCSTCQATTAKTDWVFLKEIKND